MQGSFYLIAKKQDVQKIKDDETMKDKDVSQINMHDLSLALVSKEPGDIISHIKHLTNMKSMESNREITQLETHIAGT